MFGDRRMVVINATSSDEAAKVGIAARMRSEACTNLPLSYERPAAKGQLLHFKRCWTTSVGLYMLMHFILEGSFRKARRTQTKIVQDPMDQDMQRCLADLRNCTETQAHTQDLWTCPWYVGKQNALQAKQSRTWEMITTPRLYTQCGQHQFGQTAITSLGAALWIVKQSSVASRDSPRSTKEQAGFTDHSTNCKEHAVQCKVIYLYEGGKRKRIRTDIKVEMNWSEIVEVKMLLWIRPPTSGSTRHVYHVYSDQR